MDELKSDILAEAGNVGAAHAATALGQLIERTVMIDVTRVASVPADALGALVGSPEELSAGVGLHVVGDAGGRILLWMPRQAALDLVDLLLRKPAGSTKALNELGHSTLKEVGNIMASAYLTGLCDFCGLLLMPSVPALLFDRCEAVVAMAAEGVVARDGSITVVDNGYRVEGTRLEGRLLLFLDAGSEDTLAENATGVL